MYLVVKHALEVKKLMFIKVIKNLKKSLNPVLVEGVLVIETGVPFLDYWKSLPEYNLSEYKIPHKILFKNKVMCER